VPNNCDRQTKWDGASGLQYMDSTGPSDPMEYTMGTIRQTALTDISNQIITVLYSPRQTQAYATGSSIVIQTNTKVAEPVTPVVARGSLHQLPTSVEPFSTISQPSTYNQSAITASTMGNLIMNRARYINMDDADREILLHKRREYKKLRQCVQDDTITGAPLSIQTQQHIVHDTPTHEPELRDYDTVLIEPTQPSLEGHMEHPITPHDFNISQHNEYTRSREFHGEVREMTMQNILEKTYGALYHRLDHLVPGSQGPRHLQLYFYDTEDATLAHRARRSPDLDINIIKNILTILEGNPYVQTFNRLGSIPNLDDYVIELNTNVTPDQR
ncbi:hypothetical protein ACJX0J_025910, partial [Zea mays]